MSCRILVLQNCRLSGLGRADQRLVGDPLAYGFLHQQGQLFAGVEGSDAVTTSKLIDVARQVFLGDVMVGTDVSVLEHRPMGLDSVDVRPTPNVLLDAVLDRFMVAVEAIVGRRLIGVNPRVRVGALMDEPLQLRRVGVFHNLAVMTDSIMR